MNVTAVLIVKNEERDLPRCLRSLAHVVDLGIVVDTGSTDATLRIASESAPFPVIAGQYVGASRQDDAGDWKLWDFSKARNWALENAERHDPDWILWVDADDELLNPFALYGAMARAEADVIGVTIESGVHRWVQHRAWRAKRGVRFVGRCHEYPRFDGLRTLELPECVIRHHADPKPGESSSERNLRILLEEYDEAPTPRGAFYIANTYRDLGEWMRAAEWYERRILLGEGYRDEWLFAHLYRASCQRAAGDAILAEATILRAFVHDTSWSEFWMELAYMAAQRGDFAKACQWANSAIRPIPPTLLWREPDKYDAEPRKMLQRCASHGVAA